MRVLLMVVGVVAMFAGAYGAATGVAGMSGDSVATVNVDSEYRFLSVLWLAFGVASLRVAASGAPRPVAVRALMLVLVCAGLARALSWAAEGRPDDIYVVLLALELGVPLLVLALLQGARGATRGSR